MVVGVGHYLATFSAAEMSLTHFDLQHARLPHNKLVSVYDECTRSVEAVPEQKTTLLNRLGVVSFIHIPPAAYGVKSTLAARCGLLNVVLDV